MRSHKLLSTLAVIGFSAGGIAAPAHAAVRDAVGWVGVAPSFGVHATGGQGGTPDMGQMHEQMMQKFPDMANMSQAMMSGEPGMVRMHEAMMPGHQQGLSQHGEGKQE